MKKPGRHADGRGLYLQVDESGARRWVFIFQHRRRRAEMGLGPTDRVSLAEARNLRDEARKLVALGKNPIEVRKRERAATSDLAGLTFGEWAKEIAPAIAPKATKARRAWLRMMQEKVGDLASMSPAEIVTEDVLKSLKPYWTSRPEMGRRMRQRIEKVLDGAKANGMIPDRTWHNPARLKGHLDTLLERKPKVVKHRTAVPYTEASDFMKDLANETRLAARALEFAILTAVRNIECRGARRREVDRDAKLWIIPEDRMKGEEGLRREHRVPLSDAALAILDVVLPPDGDPDDFIFPCDTSRSGMFSENALQNVIIDMGLKGKATVHGFRSTFRDWAGDVTNFQREVIEAALAHKLEDDTERAYRRGDALEKRRKLMEAWADFLNATASSSRSSETGDTSTLNQAA